MIQLYELMDYHIQILVPFVFLTLGQAAESKQNQICLIKNTCCSLISFF